MGFCKKCGKELTAEAAFCQSCGCPVDEKTASRQLFDGQGMEDYNTGGKTKGAYWVSIIGFFIAFTVRASVQEEKYSYSDFWDNRYFMGIPDDIKPLCLAIPALVAIIVSLLLVSDTESPKQKKAVAAIVSAVFVLLSILFIWYDIPTNIF